MNRSEILQKLAAGEISVDDATRLLADEPRKAAEPDGGGGVDAPTQPQPTDSAASQAYPPGTDEPDIDEPAAPAPVPPTRKRKNGGIQWLHIEVTDTRRKRDRVRVNVPVGLVRAGLWMGSKFSHHIPTDTWDKMMDALEHDEFGTLVEVDDLESGERVHIYVD